MKRFSTNFVRAKKLGFALFLLFAGLSSTLQAQVPGDYDGNGLSDFVLAQSYSGNARWGFLLAGVNPPNNVANYTSSSPAAAYVPFGYNWIDRVLPGVVYSQPNGNLRWYHANPGTAEVTLDFGKNGDTPQVGRLYGFQPQDPNIGNGVVLVVIRTKGNRLEWNFRLPNGQITSLIYGDSTDKRFVYDMDGDGVDDLVLLRVVNGQVLWIWRTVSNPTIKFFGPFGTDKQRLLRPFDVTGDGKPDFIVSDNVGSRTVVFIRPTDGRTDTVALDVGPAGCIPLAGKFYFNTISTFACFDRSTGALYFRNPYTGTLVTITGVGNGSEALIRPDRSVQQPGESESFTSGSSNTGGSSGGANTGGSCTCGGRTPISVSSIPGILYKANFPGSGDGVENHAQKGAAFLVKPAGHKGPVSRLIFDTSCKVIGRFSQYASDGPYGQRNYAYESGGSLGAKAVKNTGSATGCVETTGNRLVVIRDLYKREGKL